MRVDNAGNKKKEISRNQHQWLSKHWEAVELVIDLQNNQIDILGCENSEKYGKLFEKEIGHIPPSESPTHDHSKTKGNATMS